MGGVRASQKDDRDALYKNSGGEESPIANERSFGKKRYRATCTGVNTSSTLSEECLYGHQLCILPHLAGRSYGHKKKKPDSSRKGQREPLGQAQHISTPTLSRKPINALAILELFNAIGGGSPNNPH